MTKTLPNKATMTRDEPMIDAALTPDTGGRGGGNSGSVTAKSMRGVLMSEMEERVAGVLRSEMEERVALAIRTELAKGNCHSLDVARAAIEAMDQWRAEQVKVEIVVPE